MSVSATYFTLLSLSIIVLVTCYCQRPGFYCQNYGSCSENQTCVCPTGYRGFDCRVPPFIKSCTQTCSNHGVCVVTNTQNWCYCDYGYWGDTCQHKNDTVACGQRNITIVMHLSSPKAVSLHGHPGCQFQRVRTTPGAGIHKYQLTIDRIPAPSSPCDGAIHSMVIDGSTTVQMFHVEIQTQLGKVAPLDWITEFECTYTQSISQVIRSKPNGTAYVVKLLNNQYDHITFGDINMYEEFSLEFTPVPNSRGPNTYLTVWDLTIYDAKTSRKVADIYQDGCLSISGEERLLGPPVSSQSGMILTFAPVNKDTYLFFDYKVKLCTGRCPASNCTGVPIPKDRLGVNVHIV